MTEQITPEGHLDRLPFEIRNTLQVVIMKKMIADQIVATPGEWADRYAKLVSDIIDHVENLEIRELALNHKYEEAAELIEARLV